MKVELSYPSRVSVVIPAYNCENYISDCLESVLGQASIKEVIVVNDGSTDHTAEIVESFASVDSRLIVIEQDNSGVSVARNKGISICTAEFVTFVDADDVLPDGAISHLLNVADACKADMTYGEYSILKSGNVSPASGELSSFPEFNSSPEEVIRSLASLKCDSISGSCCRILFRRSFLVDAKPSFPVGVALGEDYIFVLRCLSNSPKIAITHTVVYYIRRGSVSVTQRWISSVEPDLKLLNVALRPLCEKDSDLLDCYHAREANLAWGICSNSFKPDAPFSTLDRFNLVKDAMGRYSDSIKLLSARGGMSPAKIMLLKAGRRFPFVLWLLFEGRAFLARLNH
jgi:glycosyltransferase involved in cell wall biosynthesis